MFNFKNCYSKYINLDHRTDRNNHMILELNKHNIDAERFSAIKTKDRVWDENKIKTMLKYGREGTVGCYYSQFELMKEAVGKNKDVFIMEDDLIFCSDINERMKKIETFLNSNPWDIFWLGTTVHINPCVWHSGKHPELMESKLGRDAEPTSDPRIIRTYGCWSTYAYIINKNSLEKIINMLDNNISKMGAIDKLFIKLQPELYTYSYVPGCVKQMDGYSDIINTVNPFSFFASLGDYWWQNKKEDFDPSNIKWN